MENPEIRSIEATGWGKGQKMENEDTWENRVEFMLDNLAALREYVDFHPEVLDDFIKQHLRCYKAWLN